MGRNNDGGYLVSKKDIKKTDILISLGLNDDWSFEETFYRLTKVNIQAYDASINKKLIFKEFMKSLVRIDNPKLAYYWLTLLIKYKRFFNQTNIKHFEKYVGLNTKDKNFCTLTSILKKQKNKMVFLKIDIEGFEYRILETLIKHQKQISGLVIEFHDCDLHLKKIENFIKKFKLDLIHIHANNYAPIRKIDKLPLVLELTFSKYNIHFINPILPNKLDMPNDKNSLEIKVNI